MSVKEHEARVKADLKDGIIRDEHYKRALKDANEFFGTDDDGNQLKN